MEEVIRHAEDDGALLISAMEKFLGRYLVVPPGMLLVLSLYIVNTYLFECFDYCAYLMITSPTKRCGKTTLAQLLFCFVGDRSLALTHRGPRHFG